CVRHETPADRARVVHGGRGQTRGASARRDAVTAAIVARARQSATPSLAARSGVARGGLAPSTSTPSTVPLTRARHAPSRVGYTSTSSGTVTRHRRARGGRERRATLPRRG